MNEGAVGLARIQQADGQQKLRPVLILRRMPPHGDWLVCGISSQLQQEVVGFDHVLAVGDPDYASSGLKASSVIRLGFLATLPHSAFAGRLGAISPSLLNLLRRRLAAHLSK
jgi:mRNA interferase MazF